MEDFAEHADIIKALFDQVRYNSLAVYKPYRKQLDFHIAGKDYRERLFCASNQSGKTVAGSMEVAMHLTGDYPDWWTGRRWNRPTTWWVAGITGETTRDSVQRTLLGRAGMEGTGAIPRDLILATSAARGVADLVDTIQVQHESGGVSHCALKTYEKGREKWQAETLDGIWFDEEPPYEIYIEGLTRTNATGGLVFITFTPLMGMSDVVRRFWVEDSPDRHITKMDITEALHIDPAQRDRIVSSYLPHEREARAYGIPVLGSGRVFPIEESLITVPAMPIPRHWARIGGMDFGIDHPFAAVMLAHDRDADIVYVTDAYRIRNATPLAHCDRLINYGKWVPWSWPHDGLIRDKGDSSTELKSLYTRHGLYMLPQRAQFDDGSYGVEAGLMMMLERMNTGRLKVFNHLNDWLDEFRLYHRKDGLVVKERDDLLCATRYGVMSLKYARTKPIEAPRRKGSRETSAWAS
ncbi:Terminase-like family [uncultured Caudovirales phage]|uniref:Terminase, large subunit n=1 Tax=uncultured Caudovirales phage TaxID=2100421 RepID=A0A6J5REI3_9CAUD|nr:Terminase-like family [uncultured Caudovirales phage]